MGDKQTNNLINKKKQDSLSKLNKKSRVDNSGFGNNIVNELHVNFISAQNETIVKSPTNCLVILGNDRPSARTSGYGGIGGTNCSTIDLVAGLSSVAPVAVDGEEQVAYADKSFILDAARIYISEMTDVDDNFGLVDGEVGNSKGKSAIALKADGLRFIARDGIKLVTKTDFRNSKGVKVTESAGIDLIANNNDETLQPMVLGYNLAECLGTLIDEMDHIQDRIQSFIKQQSEYNQKIATHTHYSPFFGIPNTADPFVAVKFGTMVVDNLLNVEVPYYTQKIDFVGLKGVYLENGEKSINSKYNRVN